MHDHIKAQTKDFNLMNQSNMNQSPEVRSNASERVHYAKSPQIPKIERQYKGSSTIYRSNLDKASSISRCNTAQANQAHKSRKLVNFTKQEIQLIGQSNKLSAGAKALN